MPLENLVDTLRAICADVFTQGNAPDAYPARFFTWWNSSTDNVKHYDNKPQSCAWAADVNFYGTDPDDVYATLEAARLALIAAGWKVNGKGYAVESGDASYTGRGFEATYIEKL